MPELPEVETIRIGLDKKLSGHIVTDINILTTKSFQGDKKEIIGKRIARVTRRAKIIRIGFSGINLLIHLKMTGQLIYLFSDKRLAGGHPSHDWHTKLPNKHTRAIITLDNGSKLFFNDLRKFGWIKVTDDKTTDEIFSKFGPEPLSKEFSASYLSGKAKKTPAKNIKQFLMDQKNIAGVGNIYNDETLYLAKIHPLTKVGQLSDSQWNTVYGSLIKTLVKGIKYGGTTDSDYVNIDGEVGGMQDHLNVYHRQNEKCRSCRGMIRRIKVNGRGTYFCPSCQKEPG